MKEYDFRQEAERYLGWCGAQPTSPHVNEFAVRLTLEPSNLSKRFKRQLGVSAGEYLKRQWVLRTIEKIQGTESSYAEIARIMGWGSVTTMFRSIRRVTKRTAESFRRRRKRT